MPAKGRSCSLRCRPTVTRAWSRAGKLQRKWVTAPAPIAGSPRPKHLGPSFPFADEALGRMLLASRDYAGAHRAFETAIAIEPRFADAHAGLGDTDAAAGDWRGAGRTAHADAARYAPRWGKLHLKWAAALWNGGRSGEARAKLDAASAMDLSQADRLLLTHSSGDRGP